MSKDSEQQSKKKKSNSAVWGQIGREAKGKQVGQASGLNRQIDSAGELTGADTADLQQTYGNSFLQRAIQADAGADTAGTLADKITPINRAGGQAPPTSDDTGVEAAINRSRGQGDPLPDGVRDQMEGGFGADFGGVKIHNDGESDRLSRELGAQAFTTGSDVYFRSGQYNPESQGGQKLIAHELTHVVQQGGAPQSGVQAKLAVNEPGDKYEAEAEQVAEDVVQSPASQTAPVADSAEADSAAHAASDSGVSVVPNEAEEAADKAGIDPNQAEDLSAKANEKVAEGEDPKEVMKGAKGQLSGKGGASVPSEASGSMMDSKGSKGEEDLSKKKKEGEDVELVNQAKADLGIKAPDIPDPEATEDKKFDPEMVEEPPEPTSLPDWNQIASGTVDLTDVGVAPEEISEHKTIKNEADAEPASQNSTSAEGDAQAASGAPALYSGASLEDLDRDELIRDALAGGVAEGAVQGVSDAIADTLIDTISARAPFMDGVLAGVNIAADPKGWANGVSKTFGAENAKQTFGGWGDISKETTKEGRVAFVLEKLVGIIGWVEAIVGFFQQMLSLGVAFLYLLWSIASAIPGGQGVAAALMAVIKFLEMLIKWLAFFSALVGLLKPPLQMTIIGLRIADLKKAKANPEELLQKQAKLRGVTSSFTSGVAKRGTSAGIKAGVNAVKKRNARKRIAEAAEDGAADGTGKTKGQLKEEYKAQFGEDLDGPAKSKKETAKRIGLGAVGILMGNDIVSLGKGGLRGLAKDNGLADERVDPNDTTKKQTKMKDWGGLFEESGSVWEAYKKQNDNKIDDARAAVKGGSDYAHQAADIENNKLKIPREKEGRLTAAVDTADTQLKNLRQEETSTTEEKNRLAQDASDGVLQTLELNKSKYEREQAGVASEKQTTENNIRNKEADVQSQADAIKRTEFDLEIEKRNLKGKERRRDLFSDTDIQDSQQRIAALEKGKQKAEAEKAQAEAEIDRSKKKLELIDKMEKKIEADLAENQQNKQQFDADKARIEALEGELTTLTQNIADAESALSDANNDKAHFEGLPAFTEYQAAKEEMAALDEKWRLVQLDEKWGLSKKKLGEFDGYTDYLKKKMLQDKNPKTLNGHMKKIYEAIGTSDWVVDTINNRAYLDLTFKNMHNLPAGSTVVPQDPSGADNPGISFETKVGEAAFSRPILAFGSPDAIPSAHKMLTPYSKDAPMAVKGADLIVTNEQGVQEVWRPNITQTSAEIDHLILDALDKQYGIKTKSGQKIKTFKYDITYVKQQAPDAADPTDVADGTVVQSKGAPGEEEMLEKQMAGKQRMADQLPEPPEEATHDINASAAAYNALAVEEYVLHFQHQEISQFGEDVEGQQMEADAVAATVEMNQSAMDKHEAVTEESQQSQKEMEEGAKQAEEPASEGFDVSQELSKLIQSIIQPLVMGLVTAGQESGSGDQSGGTKQVDEFGGKQNDAMGMAVDTSAESQATSKEWQGESAALRQDIQTQKGEWKQLEKFADKEQNELEKGSDSISEAGEANAEQLEEIQGAMDEQVTTYEESSSELDSWASEHQDMRLDLFEQLAADLLQDQAAVAEPEQEEQEL